MTLFEWLFQNPAALHRQTTAPLYNERLAFLTHMKEHDRKYTALRAMATHLLHINRTLGFSNEIRVLTIERRRSRVGTIQRSFAKESSGRVVL
jgi:hypothetical protein